MLPHQNKILEMYMDLALYWTLNVYFLPLIMFSDVDDFVTKVSLNGIKSNRCL